eukprot:TRINITY_DN1133_c1_g2_i6.p3 TRINITY_DN1133_c1_g2~~TRINITY_DN1133_c1_g2_i6.p3  ORF type:complete len:111 (+),score=8.93 TRINITY_DN1133_c1_g2_i6:1051-1383(+)
MGWFFAKLPYNQIRTFVQVHSSNKKTHLIIQQLSILQQKIPKKFLIDQNCLQEYISGVTLLARSSIAVNFIAQQTLGSVSGSVSASSGHTAVSGESAGLPVAENKISPFL